MLLCAGVSEKGPVKSVNQDAYLVKRAQTSAGDVALAVVADGMSGLQRGQVASGAIVRAFDEWFQRDLPLAGESLGFSGAAFARAVQVQWANLLQEINLSLLKCGLHEGVSMGAACTVFLVAAETYYVMQVGDTRLYCLDDRAVCQITRDQTFAAREIAAGRLTSNEAERHPLRNSLLQCVGASHDLTPVFSQGPFDKRYSYLVCSDGFRRSLTDAELHQALNASTLRARGVAECGEGAGTAASQGTGAGMAPAADAARGARAADASMRTTDASAGAAAASFPGASSDERLKAYLRQLMDVVFARGQRDNATVVAMTSGAAPSVSSSGCNESERCGSC